MKHRWAFIPGCSCVVGVALYAAACEPSTSGQTEFTGDGGVPRSGDGSVQMPPAPGPPIDWDAADDPPPPPPNDNDGVKCEGVPIGVGAVDQSQLGVSGALFLTPTTGEPQQTFTTGADGFLTGVELLVQRSSVGAGTTVGSMRVELFNGAGSRLGEKVLPLTTFPLGDDGDITLSGAAGAGYFPLGALCAKFKAGDGYKIKLSLVDVPDGVCSDVVNPDAGTCTVGRIGDACSLHTHCDYRIRIQDSGGKSTYDAGNLVGFKSTDLVFRTYVQP